MSGIVGTVGFAFAAFVALQQAAEKAPPPESPPPVPLAADHPLQPALATIRADDLRDYEAWLASDERKGRCAGEPGNDEAADWIAAKFEELGLLPLGEDGTYLQHFDFRVRGGSGGKMARTQNVVALWEGSDPLLKQQVVVIGAHFDHVGTIDSPDAGRYPGPPGDTIWNGADDNGSGTCTLIEVAEAFAESGLQPKRSLLFIAFSAEEQGLFGSAHFCRAPTIPQERIVAMLNMDMVGRIPPDGKIEMAACGSLENDLWPKLIEASRPAAPSLLFALQSQSRPDSDHASFIDAGIPATFIFTGTHADYHRATDSPDKIAYDHMAEIGRFATALLWNTANCEEKLVFAKPKFEPRGKAKRLGIGVDGEVSGARMQELGFPKEQGGFEVKELDPAGVGTKAGLQPGDILLAIDGKELSSDDVLVSLRRLVAGAPSKRDVPIRVLRGKEQVTLTARWE